jgi:hypothetical protein
MPLDQKAARRLVEHIVEAKRAFADARAAERALRRRYLDALRRLTAARYRAQAAHASGDARGARRAEAAIQRHQAVVRALPAQRKRCEQQLTRCRNSFHSAAARLVGPREEPLPAVRRVLQAARAEIRAQVDEVEALLRSAPGRTGPAHPGFDRQLRRTMSEVRTALFDVRLALALATADEHRLATRHRRAVMDLEHWTRIHAEAAQDDDQTQATILAPMVARLSEDAAAVARCLAEQQEFARAIKDRYASLTDEEEQKRYGLLADDALARARAALMTARRVLSRASFDDAKKSLARGIAAGKLFEHLLEDKGRSGAAPAWIERRLLAHRQALEDLFQRFRELARLHGPDDRPPN